MYSFWHENMFKILTVSGALPQTLRESLRRSQDPLVARGFLSWAVAASRLRRLQFPHGLKSNYIKERWLMRLGGICARGLGGIDAPGPAYSVLKVWLLRTGFGIAPVNKLVFLTWLL